MRLGNLHPTRDLNYVSNTVDGFLRAAEMTEAIGKTFNLGSGREISIGDLAKMIGKLTRTSVQIKSDDQRVRPEGSEVERLLADNSLAQKVLDWEPKVQLEEGLERTIAWIREHPESYRPEIYNL